MNYADSYLGISKDMQPCQAILYIRWLLQRLNTMSRGFRNIIYKQQQSQLQQSSNVQSQS